MFNVRVYLTNICLAAFDGVVTGLCYLLVVCWYVAGTSLSLWNGPASSSLAVGGAVAVSLWVLFSIYLGMYRSRRLDSQWADLFVIFKVGLASWVCVQGIGAILPHLELVRLINALFLLVNCIVLIALRWMLRLFLREMRRRGYDVKRLILIASREMGDRLEQRIEERAHYGYRIVERFNYDDTDADQFLVQCIEDKLRQGAVDDVIVALPGRANDLAVRLVADCEAYGINVRIVPDLLPFVQSETQMCNLDGLPLINARLYPTEYLGYVVFKRIFDVCLSLLVLILFSPLFLIIAALVKLTSSGPVFFLQDRVGMNGKRFRIIKFRTMAQSPQLDPDSHWTVNNDCHVTAFGRWLRRSNLDELPQFFNVLKGEMSIVGPRPERPFFLDKFRREVPEYMARHYVKSGITGWAQVNGWRGDTAIPQRVACDLYYIRNWAVLFDLKIVVLTLIQTLFPWVGYGLRGEKPRES